MDKTDFDYYNEFSINKNKLIKLSDLWKNVNFDDVVFGDIFKLIRKSFSDREILGLFRVKFSPFYKEMFKDNVETNYSFDYLLFSVELNKHNDGCSTMFSICGKKEGDKEKYALDFEKLYNIKDCKIKMNKEILFIDFTKDKELAMNNIDCQMQVNLFTFIHTVLWEISFYGDPKNREKEENRLIKICERINSGEEKLVPMEEVFQKIKDKYK